MPNSIKTLDSHAEDKKLSNFSDKNLTSKTPREFTPPHQKVSSSWTLIFYFFLHSFPLMTDPCFAIAHVSVRQRAYRLPEMSSEDDPLSIVPCSNGPGQMPGRW